MKYFCTKNELHGSDCHEFFSGEWDGRHWNDDSLYIYDDAFRESGLRSLMRTVIPDYSPYDATEIYPSDWEKLCESAEGEAAKALDEVGDWAERAFSEHGSFTLLGI